MSSSTANLVLAPDTPIDLQTHTLYSDGEWTPEGLMDYAVKEGFGLIAITDHDRPDITDMLQTLAAEKGLPVLFAVEMTTNWRGEMTDILCYGFDPAKDDLKRLAEDLHRRQRENSSMVYENLIEKGYTFSSEPDALETLLQKPSAQHPHAIVNLLKRHGYGNQETSAGRIALDAGVAFITSDIGAVVEAGHRNGGVCLIAHPGRDDGFPCFTVDMLDQLREEVPIDGFEVYYPAHTPEQISTYLDYAQKHQLLISSGSDSHRPDKPPIKYHAELSRNLLERVGIQVR